MPLLKEKVFAKLIIFLAFIPLFFFCESKDSAKVLIREIPFLGNLISKEINLSNAALMPSKIVTFPDKAMVFDLGGKKDIFKVYSLPDLSFLYAFGEIGEGPDEFRFVDENSLKAPWGKFNSSVRFTND